MRVAVLAAALGLASSGCATNFATDNSSSMILEVAGLAPSGGGPGEQLLSDVADDNGTVINDDVDLTMNLYRKNPSVSATSALEHVYLDRAEVRFFRSDGHNAPGIDVPYAFTASLGNARFHTPTSTGEVELIVPFTLVRHAAKLEPPLRNLRGNSGQIVITCIAEVTVYARQLDGQTLRASGTMQVTFGDFPG
jgi:hypothetical protein